MTPNITWTGMQVKGWGSEAASTTSSWEINTTYSFNTKKTMYALPKTNILGVRLIEDNPYKTNVNFLITVTSANEGIYIMDIANPGLNQLWSVIFDYSAIKTGVNYLTAVTNENSGLYVYTSN